MLAAVAVAAGGDAVARFDYVDANADLGLRGGRIRYDGAGDARLVRVRWTRDTTLSGRVTLTRAGARGVLTVTHHGASAQRVAVRWGAGRFAVVRLDGVRLRAPAP